MNAGLCDFSICGALEKHLLTYLLTYLQWLKIEEKEFIPQVISKQTIWVLNVP